MPFRDFITRGALAQELLAKEVLAEVPDQFLSYMKSRQIRPSPPRPISTNQITPIIGGPVNQGAPYPTSESAAPYPSTNPSTPANPSAPYPTQNNMPVIHRP